MKTYIFDIESDGLLDTISKIHCLVLRDVDTNEVFDFSDEKYGKGSIEKGVRLLMGAKRIIGHNSIKFDSVKTNCAACVACGGHGAKARVDIAIVAHGSASVTKAFNARVAA